MFHVLSNRPMKVGNGDIFDRYRLVVTAYFNLIDSNASLLVNFIYLFIYFKIFLKIEKKKKKNSKVQGPFSVCLQVRE